MSLETGTYISDLVASNPVSTDGLNQADDHLRLIKGALRATFPNFTAAAMASTQAEIDNAAHVGQVSAQNGSAGTPSITFKTDATAGFRKGALTGQTLIEGSLRGSGTVPAGALVDWPKQPPRFSNAAVPAGGQSAIDWLELDGSLYNISDFPDLGAFLGSTFGGNGTTTFAVPNTKDTGRFRRSRSATLGAGAYQTNAIGTHTHTGTTASAGAHVHTATVTDPGHHHTYLGLPNQGTVGGGSKDLSVDGNSTTDLAVTGISVDIASSGTHTHTFTTDATGTTETRPETFVVFACIKT